MDTADRPGQVLWHVTASLDGFIADRDDRIDWAFGHGRPGPVADEVVAATGAVLAGRRCYDSGIRAGGPRAIYGGRWSGPIFVLTHRPPTHAGEDGIVFLTDGIEAAVATARAAAGPRAVGVFGACIARQCLAAGLLDEIVIHQVPVLVGEGVRLYETTGGVPITLAPIADTPAIVDFDLRVAR